MSQHTRPTASSLSRTNTSNPLFSDFIQALSENGNMNPTLTFADLRKVLDTIEVLNKKQTDLRKANKALKKEVTHLSAKVSKLQEEHGKEIREASLLNKKLQEDIVMLQAAQKQQAYKTIALTNRMDTLLPEKRETSS